MVTIEDILRAQGYSQIPEGVPGSGRTKVPLIIADGSKVTRALGFEYHPTKTTILDMYKNLKERFANPSDRNYFFE